MQRVWSSMNVFGVFLTLILFGNLFGCAGQQQKRAEQVTMENRLADIQRSIDLAGQRMEAMQNDVMMLQDQMETTRLQVQKMAVNTPRPVNRVQTTPPPLIEIHSADSSRAKKTSQSSRSLATTGAAKTPLTLYREAYQLYENGKLFEAQEKFAKFVKENPQHDYADNAIYWMGEVYYDQKEYLLAVSEFQRVINEYPTSNKLADAWLKVGLIYEILEDTAQASKAYQKVAMQFPYAPAAQRAEERLNKLKQK